MRTCTRADYVSFVESIKYAKAHGININMRRLKEECHIARVKGFSESEILAIVDDRDTYTIAEQLKKICHDYFLNYRKKPLEKSNVDSIAIKNTSNNNWIITKDIADEILVIGNKLIDIAYKIKYKSN